MLGRFFYLLRRTTAEAARQQLPHAARIAGLAAALSVALGGLPAVLASALVPHSAHYDIKLLSVRSGGNVSEVSGDMAVQWEGDCSGWTLHHRMLFDVGYADGATVRIKVDASTWESRSGDRYTYSVRTLYDDREAERIEGHARRDGAKSKAVFSAPDGKTVQLPRDVLFPTAHTEKVLAAARKGRTIVPARVFDGFTDDGALLVNAVIGNRLADGDAAAKAFPALAGHAAWVVQLAFFPTDSAEAEPQSEIGMILYDNGVARNLDMGFGEFGIRADLKRLEVAERPVCGH